MSSNYVFYGVNKAMKEKILDILSYSKEIRNSKYLVNGNGKFDITSLDVRKNQDIYVILGTIKCDDVERSIEAYMIGEERVKLYLDVRKDNNLISKTSESFVICDDKVIVTTEYALTDEVFRDELVFDDSEDFEQLGILVNA